MIADCLNNTEKTSCGRLDIGNPKDCSDQNMRRTENHISRTAKFCMCMDSSRVPEYRFSCRRHCAADCPLHDTNVSDRNLPSQPQSDISLSAGLTDPVHSIHNKEGLHTASRQTASASNASIQKAVAIDEFRAQKEIKSLLFIAEQYLGKTLTHTEMETITYFMIHCICRQI